MAGFHKNHWQGIIGISIPQITKKLQEVVQEEEGFNKVLTVALESIMQAERELHNSTSKDVSNGYRWRKVFGHGKQLKLEVPRSRNEHFLSGSFECVKGPGIGSQINSI